MAKYDVKVRYAFEGTYTVVAEDRDLGSIPMHNIVPRLSASPGHFTRPAPRLGEHTQEILAELDKLA